MSTSGSGGRQNNTYANKQNQPQRNTDAKVELELCRVNKKKRIRDALLIQIELNFSFITQEKAGAVCCSN